MITKFTTSPINAPYVRFAFQIRNESPSNPPTLKQPMIGEIILSRSDVTRPENAPPMITPIAISTIFPLIINALKSSKNFFEWKFNAIGSGFQGGLSALCGNFGVNV